MLHYICQRITRQTTINVSELCNQNLRGLSSSISAVYAVHNKIQVLELQEGLLVLLNPNSDRNMHRSTHPDSTSSHLPLGRQLFSR